MRLEHFDSAVFVTQFDFDKITNFDEFEKKVKWLSKELRLTKAYIETHRSGIFVEREKLLMAKAIFAKYGVKTAGGITFTETFDPEYEQLFGTLCYSREETREKVKAIVRYTSELFDEYIMDDFYFTHCKCDHCIEKKGMKSWSEYRLELLRDVAENIIIKESKAVNSEVKVILKYPNWYDHYHKAGYNLEMAADLFDGIYTGTETRDPFHTQQNIQRYSSYFLMRYIENVKLGKNGGGWFDTLDCSYQLNSVPEQAHLTLFAKGKECTVYNFGAVTEDDAVFAPLLGYSYERLDKLIPHLGKPKGIAAYKPFHSSGEDFLHGYLGMLGIPIEPFPYFPQEEKVLLLTATAAKDEDILNKIKKYLAAGNTLFMTSGFVSSLQDQGIEEIADVRVTPNKGRVKNFGLEWKLCAYDRYCEAREEMALTQIDFGANDTKNTISGLKNNKSYPLLLQTHYSKGVVYVLNIPDEYGALTDLPKEVVDEIRKLMMQDLFIEVKGKAPFGLFVYDNDGFIIHSFDKHTNVYEVFLDEKYDILVDLETGEKLKGQRIGQKVKYNISVKASYFKAFRAF